MTVPSFLRSREDVEAWAEKSVRRVGRTSAGALFIPTLALALAVGVSCVRAILARAGHAAVPLDDAFIHFQYAKRLATGHFFSYSSGDGYSSGATSLLWPAALAPFYLVGLREERIIWAAWALAWAALLALAIETYRLGERLAGRGASIGAAAMVLCFAGYAWCASSGMEVVPLAWILATIGRRSVEWVEAPPPERSVRGQHALVLLALLAPLVRPEGAVGTLLAGLTLAACPRARARGRWVARLTPAFAAGLGLLVTPILNRLATGSFASSTTMVKWLPANPYYAGPRDLFDAILANARLLVDTLLDGREWSAVFVPSGSRPFALASLAAIAAAGHMRRRYARASVVLALALGMFIPCTYSTFLWNRLRYLWPFAFAWFIGAACLADLIARTLALFQPRLLAAGGVLSGLAAGALLGRLGWTIDDLSQSASAIDRQHVKLGRWAKENLPADAILGVNDTGALAYFSDRRTFDVVGLTTPGEARYWTAGAGSRFEHYERLYRAAPDRMPTHFIVYPHWLACESVLGDKLEEASVFDQTILGGTTMGVYEARYDLLGSGDLPQEPPAGVLADELDVADLESEEGHGYVLGSARETQNVSLSFETEDDRAIADGARAQRTEDRFGMRAPGGRRLVLVGRWTSDHPTHVAVEVGGGAPVQVEIGDDGWTEAPIALDALRPTSARGAELSITVRAEEGSRFGSAHYWLYAEP